MATLTRPYFPLQRPGLATGSDHRAVITQLPEIPRRARAKRGEGDKLRLEILDAVDKLLTESTPKDDGVSIRAVADLVGCTPPAIYLHFFDKNELLFEVCARRFTQLNAEIDAATAGLTDPVAALEAGTRAYVKFGLEHPEHYRVLFMGRSILTPEQLDEMRSTGVTGLNRLLDRCQACIDAGAVRPTDARLMACGVWTISHGIVSLMISKPHVEWPNLDDLLDHVIGTHINGIRV